VTGLGRARLEAPSVARRRPMALTALATLDILLVAIALAPAAAVAGLMGAPRDSAALLAVAGLSALVAGLAAVAATGILQLEEYGRRAQLTLLSVGMLFVPVGTLVSFLLWTYLKKPEVRLLFSGRAHVHGARPAGSGDIRTETGMALAAIFVALVMAGVTLLGLIAIIALT